MLDSSHGAGGAIGSELLRRLGCELTTLGAAPDGRYEHPAEPTESNLKNFALVVHAVRADVGFAQDPDADRLAIVDETGRYIGEELTIALAACHRLDKTGGSNRCQPLDNPPHRRHRRSPGRLGGTRSGG